MYSRAFVSFAQMRGGLPVYIQADLGQLRSALEQQGGDVQRLRALLAPVLRMQPTEQLVLRRSFKDPQGDVHYWFGNTIDGLDVIDSGFVVHTRGKDGVIESMSLWYLPDEGMPRAPRIGATEILAAIPAKEIPVRDAVLTSAPRLAYFRSADGSGALGWRLEVATSSGSDNPPSCGEGPTLPSSILFADAESGHVLRVEGAERQAKFREIYG